MGALTAPRTTIRRDGRTYVPGVAAGVTIFAGALVMLASGFARPARAGQGGDDAAKATDAAASQALGVAQESVTGGAADGDVTVNVQTGEWAFANSAGADAITAADIGRECFVADDQTVARTSANGTRPSAGRITDVDEDGIWVDVGKSGDGPRSVILPFAINQTDLLAGTSAELVSPVAGRIARVTAIVQTAVTTGGNITAAVGVTAVDGLAVAIANGAAKGTVVSDAPTDGHASAVVTVGSRIQVVPAAAFDTAGAVSGFVEILY